MDIYLNPNEKINDYTIIKIIGEGRYGIVYLAENSESLKFVIKQLKTDMLEKTKKKLFYEMKFLKKLDDNRFPKFIEEFNIDNIPYYVLEYIEGNDFHDILTYNEYEFSRDEIYQIAGEIIDIIYTLQENNIVHRDIRTSNVIANPDRGLVLIDFGLARYIDKKHPEEMDYWFLGDFLIHLYYSTYYGDFDEEDKPWYEELDLTPRESLFLKRLMSIEKEYSSLDEIRDELKIIKSENNL